jgi:hypothetical protein
MCVNGAGIRTVSTYSWTRAVRLNPWSGMLYVNADAGSVIRSFDSTVISPVTSPVESQTGSLTGSEYDGSVGGGLPGPGITSGGIGFNPNWTTNGYKGCVIDTGYGMYAKWRDYAPQTASQNWGELQEGTTNNPQNDAGCFAQYQPTKGGYPAYMDRPNIGGTDWDRWVVLDNGLGIYRAGVAVTGASNTNRGGRTTASDGVLLSSTELQGLVPGVNDSFMDVAVRYPNYDGEGQTEFEIYLQSVDLDEGEESTYLTAIKVTLPSADSTSPGSWTWVQLDVDGVTGGDKWFELRDTVADLPLISTHADAAARGVNYRQGVGITFSVDGETLYVVGDCVLSNGNMADDGRIYIFGPPTPRGTVVMFR